MAKKNLIEPQQRTPRNEEVDFLAGTLEVLKNEMSQICDYLDANRIEDAIKGGKIDAVKLRNELVSNMNDYQQSFAELTGLVAFYRKHNLDKKAVRKGYTHTSGAEDVFSLLDKNNIDGGAVMGS